MGVVVFDPSAWATMFPQFASLGPVVAQGYFNIATLYLANGDTSPVQDVAKRAQLLDLLTAHIAALFERAAQGGNAGGIVGPITNASEGSVSVGVYVPQTPNSFWYLQTPWGALYWQATAQFRTFRYAVPPPYSFGPVPWAGGPTTRVLR